MVQSQSRLKLIGRLKALVLNQHFNIGNVDYVDWFRAVDRETPALLAMDDHGFEVGIRTLLFQLGSSHTNFYHVGTNPTLPQYSIGATLRSVPNGEGRWMFLDVFDSSPAALAGIRPGYFLKSVDGEMSVPPSLPIFRFGQSHQVAVTVPHQKKTEELTVRIPRPSSQRGRPPLVEPKSVGHFMLENVGILKIPYFSGAFGLSFSRLLDSAIASLKAQGCDRLIIDLRGCLGGSLGFARLASYLCPGRVPIGYDVTRKRLQRGYDVAKFPRVPMPSSRLELLFCLLRFSLQDKSLVLLTQGLGSQPFHGRVVILVNEWTNSAGEMAAQFAKDAQLATIVGRQTRGNVLGATMFDVGNGYQIYLPIFGWYSANGNYTERSGVQPDVTIDLDPNRLSYGEDAQISKAIELLQGSEV